MPAPLPLGICFYTEGRALNNFREFVPCTSGTYDNYNTPFGINRGLQTTKGEGGIQYGAVISRNFIFAVFAD